MNKYQNLGQVTFYNGAAAQGTIEEVRAAVIAAVVLVFLDS
jgi:hypothetical protein